MAADDNEDHCAVHGQVEPCTWCAGERKAVRDGVTPETVRDRVRRGADLAGDRVRTDAAPADGERTCALPGCDRTFTPTNARHRYCKPSHRAADHRRVRTDGAP